MTVTVTTPQRVRLAWPLQCVKIAVNLAVYTNSVKCTGYTMNSVPGSQKVARPASKESQPISAPSLLRVKWATLLLLTICKQLVKQYEDSGV